MTNLLESSVALLRTIQNAGSYVNRLPAELLLQILSPPSRCAEDSIGHWLKVLQVCRRWRSVLLSQSTPWTIINTYFPRSVNLLRYFLAKSGAHPIDVHVRSFFSLYAVADETHRLKTLHIASTRTWDDEEAYMLELLCKPAPPSNAK